MITGLSALGDELDWFEAHAQARSLLLGAELHPVVPALRRLSDRRPGYSAPFQVLLALFYGVEVAYTVARVGPSRGPGAVRRVYRPVDP